LTALEDCPSCDADKLDFHCNASLTALNLAKADLLNRHVSPEPISFSIASYKRLALNDHLLDKGRLDSFDFIENVLVLSRISYEHMRVSGGLILLFEVP
jgi:hypothetical protein